VKNHDTNVVVSSSHLLSDIRILIETSRQRVANGINTELSLLYWSVGNRINDDVLENERAEYGKHVLSTLSKELTSEFGKGWSEQQLKQCIWFAKIYPEKQISYTLCNQLSWSHIRLILPMTDTLKRDFYIEMCKAERWSVRVLSDRINSILYERTALSKKPKKNIKKELTLLKNEGKLTPDLMKLT
jgi:hypothetical protein